MTDNVNYNNFDALSSKPSYSGKETTSPSNKVYEKTCEYLIPLLIPVTTAFVGWYANRKCAAKVKQNEALKGELTRLREDIRDAPSLRSLPSVEDKSKRAEIMKEEDQELMTIRKDLDKISKLLEERQDIYCSVFTRRKNRHKIEEDLKSFAFSRRYDKDIRLYSGLVDIFQFDSHCDNYGSHRNGCMMWVYMDMWCNMARLRKYQRIESRMSEEGAK